MLGDYFRYHKTGGGGGGLHFKSKLQEVGKTFFILNSMEIIYNGYFIWLCTVFQFCYFLLYPTVVKRLKCGMLGAFTAHSVSLSA